MAAMSAAVLMDEQSVRPLAQGLAQLSALDLARL
jgi:hypothetical protein